MATQIVDKLELVQIEIGDGVADFLAARTLDCALQPLLELATILQPGKRIVLSLIRKGVGKLSIPADVMHAQHHTQHLAGGGCDRRYASVERVFMAGGGHHGRVIGQEQRASFNQYLLDGDFQRFAGVVVDEPHNLAERLPCGGQRTDARESLRHGVQVNNLSVSVRDDRRLTREFEHHLRGIAQMITLKARQIRGPACRGVLANGDVANTLKDFFHVP